MNARLIAWALFVLASGVLMVALSARGERAIVLGELLFSAGIIGYWFELGRVVFQRRAA